MASPPFTLSTTTPGDSDVVSQFPLNERTLRDIIQSWILANHDANGNHVVAIMPWQGSTPATPGASLNTVYSDVNGRLKYVMPDGSLNFVGNPPGAIIFSASSVTPVGYLIADGSAVSRATYADLFNALGVLYGSGDGSTTFNLPDLRGRVVAAEDSGAGRLTTLAFVSAVLAAVGGSQIQTLTANQIPTITSSNLAQSITLGGLAGAVTAGNVFDTGALGGTGRRVLDSAGGVSNFFPTGVVAIGVTSNNTGGLPHPNVQPTIIQRGLIKT